jgi:hypothetical protein
MTCGPSYFTSTGFFKGSKTDLWYVIFSILSASALFVSLLIFIVLILTGHFPFGRYKRDGKRGVKAKERRWALLETFFLNRTETLSGDPHSLYYGVL